MFVYVIVCSESLKLYVGQHKGDDLQKYLHQKVSHALHGASKNSYLYNAMRAHPKSSWSIHPLVSGVETRAELDGLERHYIKVLKCQHPDIGYNICRGGEGFTGPHTEQWRRETLARINKYWSDPAAREKRSQKMKERWATDPEFRQKMTELSKQQRHCLGRVQSEAEKQQRSASNKGKQNRLGQKRSAEEKAKGSASLKRYYQTHSHYVASAATRQRMRDARLAFLALK